jgi:plasmid stabilization system protein ParE
LGEVPALRLRYTRRASIDLARIVQYLNERSPQGARKVQARIQELINLTLEHPYAGTRTRKKRVRRLVAYPYPYLIFYEATDDGITVLGIRHAARKPSPMLG